MLTFKELWTRLIEGDESVMLEAKTASQLGKSILETVSAFANEPDTGGGYFLLGVQRKENSLFPDYEVVGVEDPDKLQSDIATQCRDSFSSPIRPRFSTETVSGKTVIVVQVPEAPIHQKPIYLKSRGSLRGAFRRIGPTDQVCTEDDLSMFFQARGNSSFDETEIAGSVIEDIDLGVLKAYRNARSGDEVADELISLPDDELLYALNAVSGRGDKSTLTLAGLLLFGKQSSLRRYLPMTRVDYIRVNGNEWVEDTETRYQAIEKTGPLITIIPQLINLVLDDIPKAFSLPESEDHRKDKPLVPRKVIREAIVNALMHRSYRANQPVQIIRFANRIEIKNPGYSLIPDEKLGEAGSRTRNPKIAAALHDVGLAETKGTGIKVMRKSMSRANLTLPLIESDRIRDEFTLRLLVHHLLDESDVAWLSNFSACKLTDDEARSLIILREIRRLDNATYRQVNHMDALTASGHLRRLRDLGILEQRGKGASTYYLPGPTFFSPKKRGKRKPSTSAAELLTEAERKQLEALRKELPKEIAQEVAGLKQRVSPDVLNAILVRLCNLRPYNATEVGLLLGKNPDHLRNRNIKSLLADGQLTYLYPDEPTHPDQRYLASVEFS